jgi:hypothetical protein
MHIHLQGRIEYHSDNVSAIILQIVEISIL